jgi:hypothetical protein
MSNEITANRSSLKEFLASLATISGDVSNITAPPFVLADNSTVEIPQYWADHPWLFTAPASEESAEKRALLVLKNFLGSLRNQQYAGRKEEDGVKKPLNAFLGELFLGSWNNEELGETRLIAEQVGHHPPVTACYLWNDKQGIRAEGFTQQEITFSGKVNIKQHGYAIVHVDKYDEDFLLPLPAIQVKSILSGVPYPELQGEYSIISSSGYVSHIKFEGKSLFGSGHKHSFEARMFHADRPDETLYTLGGAWNGISTLKDARSGSEVETFDVTTIKSLPLSVPDISEQDPWESRKAWHDVISALHRGDMKGVTSAKSVLENGQRQMRKDEEARGEEWRPIFFQNATHDPVFKKLVKYDSEGFTVAPEAGFWKVNQEAVKNARKPFHGNLSPSNERVGVSQTKSSESDQAARYEERGGTTAVSSGHSQAAPVQNGYVSADQQRASLTTEEKRASGVAVAETTASQQQPNAYTEGQWEPTDQQVEEFLRARVGNVR